jgi:hypothetical protein
MFTRSTDSILRVVVSSLQASHWLGRNGGRASLCRATPLARNDLQLYDESLPSLKLIETAMLEQDCPNLWCLTESRDSKTWEGRSKTGMATSAHGTEQVVRVSLDSNVRDEL